MSYPLGHAALGFAAHELAMGPSAVRYGWQRVLLIIGLANLPDIDILAGLLWHGNGWVFHRGPTHSILFALVAGLLAVYGGMVVTQRPRLPFLSGFSITLSHILADMYFTSVPVSLWWPWDWVRPAGHGPLEEVLALLWHNNGHDVGIMLACGGLIAAMRLVKAQPKTKPVLHVSSGIACENGGLRRRRSL